VYELAKISGLVLSNTLAYWVIYKENDVLCLVGNKENQNKNIEFKIL